MSILERLKKAKTDPDKKLFAIVAGPRLGGKTTLAGTLPGKTIMLQAAVLESGCKSAQQLAKKNKAQLEVLTFSTVEELSELINDLVTDEEFDNVYVDGLSAITDIKYSEPRITNMRKTNVWDAFREIGDTATEILLGLKGLTYPGDCKKPKNVFVTCALAVKHDSDGQIIEVSLETKGNMAVSSVTKLGEAVLTVLPPLVTDKGEGHHRLFTKSSGWWPGRLDGILKEDNPGQFEPADLSKVLTLVNGGK